MWGFRLKKQEQISVNALFVTLTYDNENLPRSENNFATLVKKDYQDFMKRLRINVQRECEYHGVKPYKISYYACGEYGGKFGRPHYHAIIFNVLEADIKKAWSAGNVFVGTVTGASIGYTIKYINKGRFQPMHKNDDRTPEFALMSKGMGANYLTPEVVAYHRSNLEKAYLTLEDGVKMAIPRYYKDKIWRVTASDKLVEKHPSIIHHFEENEKMRKKQAAFVQELNEKKVSEMSDRDLHFAKANQIEVFKQKHLKRKDL